LGNARSYTLFNLFPPRSGFVQQRVLGGGHDVPVEKIKKRIPRTMKNVSKVIPFIDEAYFYENSSTDDAYKKIVEVRNHRLFLRCVLPDWAREMLAPHFSLEHVG
jgi:predicted ABC-type ATPase